jgi:hypothetical protein
MNSDLTDEETASLLRELDGIIASDRYFLAPAGADVEGDRNKIRPAPPLKAPPPLKHHELPRVGRRRRG